MLFFPAILLPHSVADRVLLLVLTLAYLSDLRRRSSFCAGGLLIELAERFRLSHSALDQSLHHPHHACEGRVLSSWRGASGSDVDDAGGPLLAQASINGVVDPLGHLDFCRTVRADKLSSVGLLFAGCLVDHHPSLGRRRRDDRRQLGQMTGSTWRAGRSERAVLRGVCQRRTRGTQTLGARRAVGRVAAWAGVHPDSAQSPCGKGWSGMLFTSPAGVVAAGARLCGTSVWAGLAGNSRRPGGLIGGMPSFHCPPVRATGALKTDIRGDHPGTNHHRNDLAKGTAQGAQRGFIRQSLARSSG